MGLECYLVNCIKLNSADFKPDISWYYSYSLLYWLHVSLVTQEKYLIDNSGSSSANSISHANLPSRRALFSPGRGPWHARGDRGMAVPSAEQSLCPGTEALALGLGNCIQKPLTTCHQFAHYSQAALHCRNTGTLAALSGCMCIHRNSIVLSNKWHGLLNHSSLYPRAVKKREPFPFRPFFRTLLCHPPLHSQFFIMERARLGCG